MSGMMVSGCCGALLDDNFVCSWCGEQTFDLDELHDEEDE